MRVCAHVNEHMDRHADVCANTHAAEQLCESLWTRHGVHTATSCHTDGALAYVVCGSCCGQTETEGKPLGIVNND